LCIRAPGAGNQAQGQGGDAEHAGPADKRNAPSIDERRQFRRHFALPSQMPSAPFGRQAP
tara:strand:- start:2695 stop:2874 length:180 start_codon:yes stop_codon:yes gene_type:complete